MISKYFIAERFRVPKSIRRSKIKLYPELNNYDQEVRLI